MTLSKPIFNFNIRDLVTQKGPIIIEPVPFKVDITAFNQWAYEIFTQSFFTFNYFVLSFESRIGVVNGIYFLFKELIQNICPNFYFKEEYCTKENYWNFVQKFDLFLYDLRCRQDIKDYDIKVWDKINKMWNTMFIFRNNIENFEDPPVNKFPDGISFKGYLEMQNIVNNGGYKVQAIKMDYNDTVKRALTFDN